MDESAGQADSGTGTPPNSARCYGRTACGRRGRSRSQYWPPDLVVYEPVGFAGPIAADLLGVPSVRHMWGGDASRWPSSGSPTTSWSTRAPLLHSPADEDERQPARFVPYNGAATELAWLRELPGRSRYASPNANSSPSCLTACVRSSRFRCRCCRPSAQRSGSPDRCIRGPEGHSRRSLRAELVGVPKKLTTPR
jgi:Erythromycin biosynthesis protein CIII-like, N-terminal domain